MVKKLINKSIQLLEKIFNTKIDTLSFEVLKSLMVGGLGVIINMGMFFLLVNFSIIDKSKMVSMKQIIDSGFKFNVVFNDAVLKVFFIQIMIHIVLTSMSFLLQKYFTFKKKHNTAQQVKRFLIQSFFYFSIDTSLTLLFYNVFNLHELVAKLFSVSILFVYSFLTQKLWIFKEEAQAEAVE